MPISMKKYVDIKSGINNIRTATEKELIARIFTKNSDLIDDVVECEDLSAVSAIFGTTSDEYKIAEKYFGFINKYSRSPKKISYAKDFSEGVYASVTGTKELKFADDYENIQTLMSDSKTLSVKINNTVTDLSISISSSVYADIDTVCNAVKTAINTAITSAELGITCAYSSGIFSFTANAKANEKLTLSGDVADIIKISSSFAPQVVVGHAVSTYTQVFDYIYQQNNNFATFYFTSGLLPADTITLTNHINNKYPSEFMYIVSTKLEWLESVTEPTPATGVSWELIDDEDGKYNFVLPMAITATTDYNKENGTVDYMYTQYSKIGIVVDDDDTMKKLDTIRVNYYGRTQQGGQKVAFYQNGVLQGDYQDQNIYVNEIWLKDALATKFLNYMLLTPNWYANKAGQAIGQGLIVDVIERAKLNGTITTEKEISENDKVYIHSITADENAWRQIYQLGYYLITSISKVTINNQETYQFNYTLIYSKGDSIKKVEGQNILI